MPPVAEVVLLADPLEDVALLVAVVAETVVAVVAVAVAVVVEMVAAVVEEAVDAGKFTSIGKSYNNMSYQAFSFIHRIFQWRQRWRRWPWWCQGRC